MDKLSEKHEALRIPALDRFELGGSLFEPPDVFEKKGVVIINAATGVRREYYHAYAAFLSKRGYWVVTYDYRGVGDSRPARLQNFEADFLDWGQRDFPGVLEYAAGQWPQHPIYVVGHSIGGTILGMASNNQRLAGAITVGAQTAYFKDWPWPERWRLYFLWHVLFPLLTRWYGYFPGRRFQILEDLPRAIVRQWHARRLDPDFERQLGKAAHRLYFDELICPVLAIGLKDDPIGSPPALDRLHRLFRQAPVEMRILHPADFGAASIDHFGFFKKRFSENLWPVTAEWLERNAVGFPETGAG